MEWIICFDNYNLEKEFRLLDFLIELYAVIHFQIALKELLHLKSNVGKL